MTADKREKRKRGQAELPLFQKGKKESRQASLGKGEAGSISNQWGQGPFMMGECDKPQLKQNTTNRINGFLLETMVMTLMRGV